MGNWLDRSGVMIVVAAQAAVALAILLYGAPGAIPMHFAWDGQADRFGDPREAAALASAMALLSLVGTAGMRRLSRRRDDPDSSGLWAAGPIFLGVTSMVCALMASLAFGLVSADETASIAVMACVGAMLFVAGNYLGKVGPNALVGVRTPWTFASRLSWDKANRLAGRLFFWFGLLAFATAPIVPQPAGLQATIAATVAIALVAIVESWRVWRVDPERRSAF
jgi:uncharacterized membrane protein